MRLDAPFPWFGGKRKVAPEVWARLGDVRNYVEPFFGSGAETWKLMHAHWSLALALRQVEVLRVPDGDGVSVLEEAVQAVADLLGEGS